MRGYAIRWTTTPNFPPEEIVNRTETYTTSGPLADDDSWYLHLRTSDNAGNWTAGAKHWGPFKVDTGKPNSSATSPETWWRPDFVVHWSGIDGLSGVVGYDVQARDLYEDGLWWWWQAATTAMTGTFHGVQGHTYAFRSRALDRAGNWEDWPGTPDSITAIAQYDFEATGMEVTQAIQDLNNSVVLITGKRTFVRFHVKSNNLGDVGPVEATLTGRDGGSLLGELAPNNPGGTITVMESPERTELDNSFYFELPSTWLSGTITLEAEVDPDNDYAESDTGNNTQTVDVTFSDSPEVTTLIVDACYEQGGVTYHADPFHRDMIASWLRRAYPISTLHVRIGVFTPCMDERPSASQVNRILRRNMRDRGEDDDANLRYYGMIDDGGGFERGKGSFNRHMASGPVGTGTQGWDTDGSYGDWYAGHELGHTWDRRHAEFCGATGGRDYPYPSGNISPHTSDIFPDTIYGFDIETSAVYSPTWKDVMTYCLFEWISDFTYEGLRDEMLDEESSALARSRLKAARPSVAQPFLEVYGTIITSTNAVTLDTFWVTTATWSYTPGAGDYSIRLLDAGEGVLADYPFTPPADHLEQGPVWQEMTGPEEPGAVDNAVDIDEYVPWVAGTQRIAIYHGTQELASRSVSAHAPVVALTGPANGAVISGEGIDLSWVGSDGDGDPLTYWLEYSTDGGAHWQLMSGELDDSSVTVESEALPGTSQGKFRLTASDGVNTGEDETQGTFTVGNKAPEVAILSPSSAAAFVTGQTVALSAQALDLEDGSLTGAAVTWSSDLAGALGTGALMHVTGLLTGTHHITVAATDSQAATTTAEVFIFVNVTVHEMYLPLVARKY